MHREVGWMKPADSYILEFLSGCRYKGQPAHIKPASVALNLPYSANWIGQRCRALAKRGLLNAADGGYWISELGEQFLAEELEVEDLLDLDVDEE